MPRFLGRSNSRAVVSARECGLHPNHDELRGVSVSRVTWEKFISPGSLPSCHGHIAPPPRFLPLLYNLGLSFEKKLTPAGDTRASHLLFIRVNNPNTEGNLAVFRQRDWNDCGLGLVTITRTLSQMNIWNKTNGFRKFSFWCARFNKRGKKRAALEQSKSTCKAVKIQGWLCLQNIQTRLKIFPWLQFLSKTKYSKMKSLSTAIWLLWLHLC